MGVLLTAVCRGWLIEGGELGHDCGEIDEKLSAVFAGANHTRRLCTPVMDFTDVGSLHFRFSFGSFLFCVAAVNAVSP